MSSSNKKSSVKNLLSGSAVVLGIAGSVYGYQQWGNHSIERALYNIKSTVKLNSVQDNARMAFICFKLAKTNCRYTALAKAYKQSPQNESIVGEFAIAQTDTNQHDKAILTFQKYFSVADGTARHMSRFGRSLAAKEFYADSKEWYYKALRLQPTNLKLAEEMISMLRGSSQFGEALSIIGHYDLSYPQTRKIWKELALTVKQEFKAYQAEYAIKEMTISKIGQYFFAPGIISGAMDTQLFIVNPESSYTTIEKNYLQSRGIPFQDKGKITVTATNGTELTGTKVIIPSMIFGAFEIKNVEAIACDNCAFVAGKSVLSKLTTKPSKAGDSSVKIMSITQK